LRVRGSPFCNFIQAHFIFKQPRGATAGRASRGLPWPRRGPLLVSHRVQTCKLAVPAPSALAPQLSREDPSHLCAQDAPGLGCFAFVPFCQCVSFNSVLAQ
jgi:hypothetical protein